MAYATGRCMCHRALRLPFEVEDVIAMVRKVFTGRCAFHDGEDLSLIHIYRAPARPAGRLIVSVPVAVRRRDNGR